MKKYENELTWIRLRPFKNRVQNYSTAHHFFKTGDRFDSTKKYYAMVYLFSDTFTTDGKDLEMRVYANVPSKYIWSNERSKKVSIIVPDVFKLNTTVKIIDPLHMGMTKGLYVASGERYPVSKIIDKGYWGKVFIKENISKVENRG